MKNCLLMISTGILLTHNACFSMNDPKGEARRKIYELTREWQTIKTDYARTRTEKKGEFNNGRFGRSEYEIKIRKINTEEESLCNDIAEQIKDELHNNDVPAHVINRLKNMSYGPQNEIRNLQNAIHDLVENYYK